jgi:hypothetical protein
VSDTINIKDFAVMDIEQRRERHRANKENARQRAREFIAAYFATHPCVDCGKNDPMILTFDHARGEKRNNVADMVRDGLSVEAIAAEIVKCDVVCFNCHSLREQQRSKTYRWRMNKGS